MKKLSDYFPHILAIVFVVFWIFLAINPAFRYAWWAENITVIIVFLFLVFTFNKFRFSNIAYFLMVIWLFCHTIGGHYTFLNTPFGFITNLFDFQRNNFDRVGHFFVGFYAFGIAEFLYYQKRLNGVFASLFALFFIMSAAVTYEFIEWAYVLIDNGRSKIDLIGSQGDVWDAQKDMLSDTLGAIVALIIFWVVNFKKDRVVARASSI